MSGLKKEQLKESSYLYAIRDVTLLLADRKWHETGEVTAVCKKYKTTLNKVSVIVPIAEDYGWLCWPGDATPEQPPRHRHKRRIE